MTNDLVARLRLHGKGECKCDHCTAPVEAADRIEALELQIINRKLAGTEQLYDRIEALEAVLLKIVNNECWADIPELASWR